MARKIAPDSFDYIAALDNARTAFGRKLIRQRRAAGLTQADLARRARIRIETLRRIEAGEATPDSITSNRITNAIEEAQEEKEEA